jgi:hypothetical protein
MIRFSATSTKKGDPDITCIKWIRETRSPVAPDASPSEINAATITQDVMDIDYDLASYLAAIYEMCFDYCKNTLHVVKKDTIVVFTSASLMFDRREGVAVGNNVRGIANFKVNNRAYQVRFNTKTQTMSVCS